MKIRIYYHHTDSGGVVYYGEYLKFLEEARTEYLEDKGLSIKELLKEGISFVVRYQEIEYIKPVFYGDILEIKAKVTDISEIKITFDYDIHNQNSQITTKAKTVLVCVDRNLKPKKLPPDLIKKLC